MALRIAGFTLVELLLVLAVIGMVGTVSLTLGRPSGAHQAARAAQALLVWGHLQALRSGADTAVVPTARGLEVRAGAGARLCAAGTRLRSLGWRTFGSVRLERAPRAGILWRSAGGALSCAGGGVISDRLVLADDRSRYAVVVLSLGRVRVERVP